MKSKWLIGGLGASLILNLALIGFLIGAAFGPPPPWARRSFDPTDGLAQMMRFLGEERRRDLLDGRERREIGASLRELRRTQRAIYKAVVAEPFDHEALAATLAQFREQFASSQALSHAALADLIAQLTPKERRRFARQRFTRRQDARREDSGPRQEPSAGEREGAPLA